MGDSLVKRLHDLEVSQARLRDQIHQLILAQHGRRRPIDQYGDGSAGSDAALLIPGHFVHGPFHNVLKHIGHALHIYRPRTGEIIFWNRSSENLYGWKEYETLGKQVGDLLVHGESIPHLRKVMERLNKGQPWSGQLAFKKRSGEILTALVTKSPLYEDGTIVGIITVSSDAALFDDKCKETMVGGYQAQTHAQPREDGRRVQIASSVTNLASKVFLRNRAISDFENGSPQDGQH